MVSFIKFLYSHIISDPNRIRQLLLILIYNALKYTSDGYIHISAKLLQSTDQFFLKLSVTDSGCSIDPELRQKLFKLFSNLKFKEKVN